MSDLTTLSTQLADVVSAVEHSVVQVHGRRRPASGVVYGADVVLTTARTIGREDGVRVRAADGRVLDAELAGFDPATSLAVLHVTGLGAPALAPAQAAARVGQLALAVARSWSNNVTASLGIVSVIGGPLRTGRRQAIDQVIRTTAPMHDGFSGGAFLDASGALLGISTAAAIRGLGVVIPTPIAWNAAAAILEHGSPRRGYLGIAGQAVSLADSQQSLAGRKTGLLVAAVTPGSPAAAGGVLVGDVILEFDTHAVSDPEDLLDHLAGDLVGRPAAVTALRGDQLRTLTVTVGERTRSEPR